MPYPYQWSVTPASNSGIDGDVNYSELQSPGSLNDAGRAVMAGVAMYIKDRSGATASTGSSNSYAVTSSSSITTLANGIRVAFTPNHTNTGAATLTLNGFASKPIVRPDGSTLKAGDMTSGAPVEVMYSFSADKYLLFSWFPTVTSTQISDASTIGRTILTAADAAAVRTAISAQQSDATLTSLSALGTASGKFAYTTGVDTWAEADITAFARTVLDDADATTARSTLGVVIGTHVQAYDATLQALAGVTTAADKVIYSTGVDTFATADFPAQARTFLASTTATGQRSVLGASSTGDAIFTASNSDVATAALGFSGKVVAAGSFYENSTGTVTTIVVSSNIASIGTGSTPAVTFSSALSNTNYVVVPSGAIVQGGYALAVYASNLTTSGFTLNIIRNDGAGSWPNTAASPLMFVVIQDI